MLTAADVMTTEVVSVEPDTPVRDIAELLYTRRISGVPVVEHDRVIGIVSEGGGSDRTHRRDRRAAPLMVAQSLRGREPVGARLRQNAWPDCPGRYDSKRG